MGAAEEDTVNIRLDDDVEGAHIGSSDYCFIQVGEPVPVVPGFDTQSLPLQPLAVSEKFGLVFVAHSNGFFVVRTKEVIQLAKEIKEKNSSLSMKEYCIVDVPVGKVYVLALSADSSTLAATVGGDVHFFPVHSLLNKEQCPYFSSSLGDSSCVKDMRWTKRTEDQYIVLSNQGKLYNGVAQDPLKHVMDNVDAVEWSVKGKFISVATNNVLTILSSKFKKKFSISLSFKSWVDDSDFDGTIKVDSIRWIRPDCIILGCFQLSADGMEENYLIQVVTSKNGKIADASSQPILLSFSDVFQGLVDDIIPSRSGPYMCLGYVDKWELAIAANRKNTDQHIVLLAWSQDNAKQAAVIDILRDNLIPKIHLQENDDDNIVIGLCLDKVSYNDEVEVVLGADYQKLSPFCLLFCLSIDGKLFLFQVASAAGVSAVSGDASFHSEEEDVSPTASSSENVSSNYSSNSPTESVNEVDSSTASAEVHKKEPYIREGQISLKETAAEESIEQINQTQDKAGQLSPFQWKQGADVRQSTPSAFYTKGVEASCVGLSRVEKQESLGGFSSQSFPAKSFTNLFPQSANSFPKSASRTLSNENDSGREVPGKLQPATLKAVEDKKGFSVTPDVQSPFLSSSDSKPNSSLISSSNTIFSGGNFGSFSGVSPKPIGTPSAAFSSSGKVSLGGQAPLFGSTEPLSANRKSPLSLSSTLTSENSSKDQRPADKNNNRTTSTGRLLNPEPPLSKKSGNVDDMIKEMDILLERIEEPGGFREACTVQLNSSVSELEKGLDTLFGWSRKCKRIMDEQLVEVQLLRDKTVQVAAKKFYVEGIVKQATDGQYWDLWNCQRLSPELELKWQHILKVNQELTAQLIELERHLNTLEIKAFGEDRAQMRQKGCTSRYGSSRHGQSLRSLQDIMSSQLVAAEQLSESLSRQMNLLNVESPTIKKKDTRRELFEEIGIPYGSASFGSPEENKSIATPSNKKFLISSDSADVNSSSRRNQLSAIKSLGSDSLRRRRDSLDRSWTSFEPPKTTIKRMSLQEGHQTLPVDRSSLSIKMEQASSPTVERSAFARPEQQITPATTLHSSNDRGMSERASKPAFEVSSALGKTSNDSSGLFPHSKFSLKPGEAQQAQGFSKGLIDQTISLSKIKNETSNSNDKEANLLKSTFGNSKDGPNTTSLFSQSQVPKSTPTLSGVSPPNLGSKAFQSNDAANKNQNQSGLFASTSSSFSLFGSSSQNSSLSVLSTSSTPSIATISSSPAVSVSKPSSSFKASSNITSQSSISSNTVFSGSSFKLNSSFSVPSTSPTPSLAPLSQPIPTNISSSSLKASTVDSKIISSSQPLVTSPLVSGAESSFEVPEKPVPSPISTPFMNLSSESLKKERQPYKPEVSTKIIENAALETLSPKREAASKIETPILSATPSEASTLFQSASVPSLTSTAPAVSDASNSKPEPAIVLQAFEIGKTENQDDDMEEEAPETTSTTQLSLGGLGGFGLGSTPNITTPKQNPFGSSFATSTPTAVTSPMSVPSGELFRPASFSFQSPQPTGVGGFSGGFGSGNAVQAPAGGGFGQPVKIGAGQQALGTVLGSFGQSRQFGVGQPVATSPVGFGGSSGSSPPSGGFAGIASGGGGFASLASAGGGFGAAAASGGGGFAGAVSLGVGGFGGIATPGGGGFAGVASPSIGGFAGVASGGGGFAGAAPGGGGGFGGAASGGGFGAFNSQQQGSGGFSSFGNSTGGTARPPSPLFTQMRK